MSNPVRQCLIVSALLPAIAGCVASTAPLQSDSPVSVEFVEPENFTDARRAELEPPSGTLLRELEKFLVESSAQYVPSNAQLTIRITDVDLAGDFEVFRGPQADHVRITRGLYPPRITLEFRLSDRDGRPLKVGKRKLTDLDYQLRAAYPREDYLRYEKELLRDWLRREFGALENNKQPAVRRDQL